MKVELDKSDLLSLVLGSEPSSDQMSDWRIFPLGEYTDYRGWQWDRKKLEEECNEKFLWNIYKFLKNG